MCAAPAGPARPLSPLVCPTPELEPAPPATQPDPQPEFRARAASAGQQARSHVAGMVARFRQRSNSTTEERRKRAGQVISSFICLFDYLFGLREKMKVYSIGIEEVVQYGGGSE